VIIYNFNVTGFTFAPPKANPPLVINPNAVLTSPITAEHLQAVAWQRQIS
jgi:hypothetical protein